MTKDELVAKVTELETKVLGQDEEIEDIVSSKADLLTALDAAKTKSTALEKTAVLPADYVQKVCAIAKKCPLAARSGLRCSVIDVA